MQQPTTSNRLRPFRPTPFGRYTLLMPLSMGGMGEIFLARIDGPQGFEKLCVIKKILPHLAEDKDFVSRFGNEARTLVKLTHGSIAQVLDMGQHQGEPYLALEYIDGKDLRKVGARFRERGMPLPMTFVLFVMGRVLDALAYAHRKRDDDDKEIGLVHRDMSPQNILISYEGEVKVIDFGLAKSTLNASKTNPSIILGKFLYMSPEQARHAKVDKRSDLYSVGICLYELIAGKNPFEEVPPHALMAAVANPAIAHVQQVEPLCPTNIAQIIMRALSIDPDKRFQTAEELRGKLLGALLEIDPAAGPESCSRFMRDMFAAEYGAERKLLTQLKEASRSEVKSETVPDPVAPPPSRAAQVRPLTVAKSNPRVEHLPRDEATPAPTDLRQYGMEPTMPRAMTLEAQGLSFAPTPKIGGSDKGHEGDRETMPGIILDRAVGGASRATGAGDDRATGPHLAVFSSASAPSSELADDAPTRPVAVPLPRATGGGIHSPPMLEPVTSEVNVVPGPSDDSLPSLPSVMVSGLSTATTQPKNPQVQSKPPGQRTTVAGVLVPASSVRTPEVVAPLPKALEGKNRPDERLITDRGTRTRRTSVFVVLVPLIAFLGLAGFVGYTIVKEQHAEEDDEADRNSSLLKSNTDDRSRKAVKPVVIEEDSAPRVDELPLPGGPNAPEDDELAPVLPKEAPAPAPAPKVKTKIPPRILKELVATRRAFNRVEKSHNLDEKTVNFMRMKLEGLENAATEPIANENRFLQSLGDLREQIEKAK